MSENGGTTFSIDTAGLPANSILGFGMSFAEYNGYLFMGLNTTDVYRKPLEIVGVDPTTANSEQLEVYPNPVFDQMIISGYSDSPNLFLLNAHGQLVRQQSLRPNQDRVTVSDLMPGLYQLIVSSTQGYHIARVLVHR